MPVIDNFLIRGDNIVYFNTKDKTQWPIARVSNSLGKLPRWVSWDPVEFKPHTPSVLDILDALKVLYVQNFTQHREIIKELEEYLYEHQE